MAGNLSDFSEALVRKWLFSDTSATRPTQWFLALYTSAPSDSGGGTEVSASGYSRQEITFNSTGAANGSDITFGPALADWGTVTHGAVFDNGGNFLCWAALSSSVSIPTNDSYKLPAGAVTTEFD